MATFAIATDESAELAGPMTELVGDMLAVKPLSRETVMVNTEYGKSPALRARIVNLDSGEDEGVRLIFWGTVTRQVLDSTLNAEWAVGIIEQQVQAGDDTRTVYLFTTPDISTIDPERISNTIDDAVSPF